MVLEVERNGAVASEHSPPYILDREALMAKRNYLVMQGLLFLGFHLGTHSASTGSVPRSRPQWKHLVFSAAFIFLHSGHCHL